MKHEECVDSLLSQLNSDDNLNSIPHVVACPTYDIMMYESKYISLDVVHDILKVNGYGRIYRYTDKIAVRGVSEHKARRIFEDFEGKLRMEYELITSEGDVVRTGAWTHREE